MRQTRTEVTVVGAGPVGLWTALLLAETGIEVVLIDRESRTSARSYACALHPATLRLLDRYGLAESVLDRGQRVETVAFYEGAERRAEVQLSNLGGDYPFLVIVPQSVLEELLEQRLRSAGLEVQWNHRFEALSQEEDSVTVVVEELEGTSTGYIVPHWETVVKARKQLQTEFLIGADGHNSMVRPRAGLEFKRIGASESFAAIEFEVGDEAVPEVRVVLDETSTNVLWPLGKHQCRWTFQIARPDLAGDFPEKDRRAIRVSEPAVDQRIRDYLEKAAHQRAPWFKSTVEKVTWCTEVSFEKRIASEFGRNRCWLVGDAAHQTGPVGVQSMNAGFVEATGLAGALKKILRDSGSLDLLQTQGMESHERWARVLAINGAPKVTDRANSWVSKRSARLISCLPGCGMELEKLLEQLGLVLR